MKKLNIKELEITKEMYERAKEVEDIYKKLKELDCRTEEFKKLRNKVIELEDKFEEEISDEFLTLEIVNEYERREKNTQILLDSHKNTYRFTYNNDNVKEYKYFSCYKDDRKNEIMVLKSYLSTNLFPAVINGKNIKKIECVERNNNLDYR
jgi:Fe-S-cluster formation regulator IscX/YfhJ